MPLFGPKLSEKQKGELNSVVTEMNSLGSAHIQAFDAMAAQLGELYLACQTAQRAGLGRSTVTDGTVLNEAKIRLKQQQSHIGQMRAELQRIRIRDWLPKKLKKQHDEWIQYLDAESKFLGTVIEAITAPDPLVDQPGAAKLNMFVSGLNLAATMARAFRSRVKP